MKRSFTVIDTAPGEATLHAYVDGELTAAERSAVEAWLANNPASMHDVNAWRRQNQMLARLARTRQLPEMPAAMAHALTTLERASARPRPCGRVAAVLSVACLLLLAAAVAGLGTRQDSEALRDGFARQAVEAHRRFVAMSQMPRERISASGVREASLAGDQEATLLVSPPDLSRQGLALAMYRSVATGPAPGAQALYVGTGGGRVSLYMRAAEEGGDLPYAYLRDGRVGMLRWQSGDVAFALVGALGEARLIEIARAVGDAVAWNFADTGAGAEEFVAPEPAAPVRADVEPREHPPSPDGFGDAQGPPVGSAAQKPAAQET